MATRRVLLVDDDLAEIALVRRALEGAGCALEVATNASDARRRLADGAADAAVVAPECDGGEGAAVAREAAGRVAVVVLGDAGRGVARPIEADELLARIEAGRAPTATEAAALLAAERELWTAQQRDRSLGGALDEGLLQEKLRLVEEADYFDVLGVRPDADPAAIAEAAGRLLAQLDPGRCPSGEGVPEKLAEVRRVVREAAEVLLDDRLRADYRRALGR